MDVVKAPDNSRDQVLVQMVEQYQGMLLRMCYVYLQEMELAKDATQETFLKAYRALGTFRRDCSEKSWLIQIAINTCRDMKRSAWFRHTDRRITPQDLPEAASSPQNDSRLDVMCGIMQLLPREKEVIMLYYWQEMSEKEIAQSLGIAQSTVSYRLKHARNRFHDVLERRYFNGKSQG